MRRSSPAEPLTLSSAYRNLNQSTYAKIKPKKSDRPDTSESNQQLLQTSRRGSFDESQDLPDSQDQRASKVYSHYQHSLNSLNHIIDQVGFNDYFPLLVLISVEMVRMTRNLLSSYTNTSTLIYPHLPPFKNSSGIVRVVCRRPLR
jgi:hypothetical protein